MALPFFYEDFEATDAITLSDATQHHVIQVLRMREGEELVLTNGRGLKAQVRLREVGKKHGALELCSLETIEKPKRHFHLAISFTKNPARMEWLLEKATEIGIEEITPLHCSRSEKHYLKRDRLEKILQSAMVQSQQYFLPILHEPCAFTDVVQYNATAKLLAHCLPDQKEHPLQHMQPHDSCLVLVGPEGDFTKEEIQLALASGFTPISLGPTRLRTETAGLMVCSYYQSKQF